MAFEIIIIVIDYFYYDIIVNYSLYIYDSNYYIESV